MRPLRGVGNSQCRSPMQPMVVITRCQETEDFKRDRTHEALASDRHRGTHRNHRLFAYAGVVSTEPPLIRGKWNPVSAAGPRRLTRRSMPDTVRRVSTQAAKDPASRTRRYLPGVWVLRGYRRSWLRGDLLAGVTVAAYLIPQVMAYAEVAGLPAISGLWAAAAPLVVYAVLGLISPTLRRPGVQHRTDDRGGGHRTDRR